MGPVASIILMVNNYSHDIATAFLAVSGSAMWLLSRTYRSSEGKESDLLFIRIHESLRNMARYSLEWIVIAGIPRIIFYQQFEWSPMAGGLQVVAIVIKHIFMFTLVGAGIYYWTRLNKRAMHLKIKYGLT